MTEKNFAVYIMANIAWGTLYVGMTSDLAARIYQHKHDLRDGFTKKYGVKSLVYFEPHGTALSAIARDTRIKKWPRTWKINLIRTDNPDWNDLGANWYPGKMSETEIGAWLERVAKLDGPDEPGHDGQGIRN